MPRAFAAPLPRDAEVVVIGAGAAGIAAARRIAGAGRKVLVIEAASAIGGRCATDTTSFDAPFDRGARWLYNPDSSPIAKLARGVGITFISALFPIPKIALLPLLILWLGIGEEPKVATIALGVFFSTAISVYSGVDAVPRNLIRMAQSFNVPFHAIVRRVIWPGALPSILAGFRITASVALLLVVSAEMIGAQFGIGAFVLQAGNLMQTDQLLAGVVILSVFGLAVGKLISLLEARLLHWR